MLVILDLILGGGYWLVGQIVVNSQMGPHGVGLVAATVAGASVALCRTRAPLGYLLAAIGQVIALVHMITVVNGDGYWLSILATGPLAYALFRIAARHRFRWAFAGWLPTLALPIAILVVEHSIGPVFPIPLMLLPVLLLGYAEHRRHEEVVRYHARLAEFERGRSRLGVAEERLRIARELHDVVSHGMSVITVQAGSGRLVIDQHPDETDAALAAIETTGHQMLGEMRQMLGVLRADDGPPSLDPVPGLADLAQLVEQTSRAGVQVELTVSGQATQLSPGLELTVYRIIQEALANVARHAGTDACRVRLGYDWDAVTVEVLDDGRGCPAGPDGLGLTGMRERVQACGGQVEARPLPGRGFRVAARLPFPTVPPSVSPVTAAHLPESGGPSGLGLREAPTAAGRGRSRRLGVALAKLGVVGVGTFLLLLLTFMSWITYDLKDICQEARNTYGGDCLSASIDLLNDEHQDFRSRNDVLLVLGELRDPRALPVLQSYYTGNIPPREPLDKSISQYELRKAIRLIDGRTKTFLFWQYPAD